jgi:hypothetical protein
VLLACRVGRGHGGAAVEVRFAGGLLPATRTRLLLCVAVLVPRVCVCSDRSSEGLCAGYPWPLGMILVVNRF